MLDGLNKYELIKGKKAIGVELIFKSHNLYSLTTVELLKNKEGIEITDRSPKITFAEIANSEKKNLPIYISIGGKGIIHKKIQIKSESSNQDLLNQLLPNASIKEFHLQRTILSENEIWVSIIRRDALDSLTKELESLNLFSIYIYLGPFIVENTLTLINSNEIITSEHQLSVENHKITNLNRLNEETTINYLIDKEKLVSKELVAFSAALSHFVPVSNIVLIDIEKTDLAREEFFNRSKYVVMGFSALVFFFLVTIINMLVNSSFQETNNELQYQVNSKQKYVVELEKLRQELDIKEQFVQNSGLTQASKISFYSDQIALSVPNSVRLNQLFVNPLSKRINKAEDIHFNYKVMKVSGTVTKSIELNSWIKELKSHEWIAEVNIISFLQENLNTSGDFEVEIIVRS